MPKQDRVGLHANPPGEGGPATTLPADPAAALARWTQDVLPHSGEPSSIMMAVNLITLRSQVQILPPQPSKPSKALMFSGVFWLELALYATINT